MLLKDKGVLEGGSMVTHLIDTRQRSLFTGGDTIVWSREVMLKDKGVLEEGVW